MMSAEEVWKYLADLDKCFVDLSIQFAKASLHRDEEKTAVCFQELLVLDAKIFALKMVLK